MGKVLVLDKSISNKIAAGEVVERPASVVKELVENSIDANASSITIEIKNGGISFIRVTDNGIGIEEEDVNIAFLRHATSKIRTSDDLNNITSLGFRGEALASIAAVSQVELITKTKQSITGTLLEIEGGKIVKNEEIGCPQGTTIVIKNLFYNTPARLKFLKKESTEAGLISNIIERLALTHPEISFKLINNNNTIIHTNGNNDILTAILSVFGKDFAKNMISINSTINNVAISGFLGRPEISRSNRNYQCIFINGRYIKNKLISSAVEEAYKTMLTINKFPVFVLYITMPPFMVDVNVHPSKMEVRFDSDQLLYNIVYESVYNSLRGSIIIPQISLEPKEYPKDEIIKTTNNIQKINDIYEEQNVIVNEKLEDFSIKKEQEKIFKSTNKSIQYQQSAMPTLKELEQQNVRIGKDYKIIGQIFSTYIVVEMENKMFLIDQHAAHERIKYNEIYKKYTENIALSQGLTSPLVINLSYSECNIVNENADVFKKIGFEFEEFGENAFLIRSVPFVVGQSFEKENFIEIIDSISKKRIESILDLHQELLYTIACKSAVKANKSLTQTEVEKLVEEVFNLDNTFTCPHGRPVIISLQKYEIEKMFKRIQ